MKYLFLNATYEWGDNTDTVKVFKDFFDVDSSTSKCSDVGYAAEYPDATEDQGDYIKCQIEHLHLKDPILLDWMFERSKTKPDVTTIKSMLVNARNDTSPMVSLCDYVGLMHHPDPCYRHPCYDSFPMLDSFPTRFKKKFTIRNGEVQGQPTSFFLHFDEDWNLLRPASNHFIGIINTYGIITSPTFMSVNQFTHTIHGEASQSENVHFAWRAKQSENMTCVNLSFLSKVFSHVDESIQYMIFSNLPYQPKLVETRLICYFNMNNINLVQFYQGEESYGLIPIGSLFHTFRHYKKSESKTGLGPAPAL